MQRFLAVTVFVSGMATLGVELAAARLLGAVFGTSNLVWASIIGLILIYLSAGYFLGGRWADRSPHAETLYTILAWAAFTTGLAPLLARLVLPGAAEAFDELRVGVLIGSFTGVLILFSVPVTLLGTISPFAIRLAVTDTARAGSAAGQVYALSTLGSFVGTFLPVLVTIPLIGTTLTFLFFALLLILVAFIGLKRASGWRPVARFVWMPVVLVAAVWIWGDTPFKRTQGQIYESESAYNYIEVLERDGFTLLRLNEGQGVHSIYHPEQLNYYGPWEMFLAAPYFREGFRREDMGRIGIIGLAAGTIARQASAVYGPVPIDGWEIDPEIIAVGRRFFDMDMPNLNAIAGDGRLGLARSEHHFTLIAVDAYRPPYIPWHLTTVEFFALVRDRLEPGGVMAINIGRAPDDRSLIEGLVGTISTVFPSVFVIDVPSSFNSVVVAAEGPASITALYENYALLDHDPTASLLLKETIATLIINLQSVPESKEVFTDDRAPIEWLTNSLVLNYLLSEGTDELQ